MTPASTRRSCVSVITTGGTIASRVGVDGTSRAGKPSAEFLADIGARAGVDVRVVDLMSVDSAAMTSADMDRIRRGVEGELRDPTIVGVVVLHGTDTLEETALLVDLMHADPRPVVFTGAQRTADHARPDGPANIEAALRVAANSRFRDHGVLVAFGPRLMHARGVRKTHTVDLDAYDGVRVTTPLPRTVMPRTDIAGVRVDVVALYAGVDEVVVDALREHGTNGIVLQALGAGNTNARIVDAVRRCTEADIPVVLSTRVPDGGVVTTYGGGGGGADLVRAGALSAGTLGPAQARIVLAAALASGQDLLSVFASEPTVAAHRA